jgi:predicted DNA-binding WGR domain protein
MSWFSTDILGSDLTLDFQFDIFVSVLGSAARSRLTTYSIDNSTDVVTAQNTAHFINVLPQIYNMARSQNKFEEAWQMQVLGKFLVENEHFCSPLIYKESARVLWNHLKYEIENINSFGWSDNFNKTVRLQKLNQLYESFGNVVWRGGQIDAHMPFGLVNSTTTPTQNPYNIPSPPVAPVNPISITVSNHTSVTSTSVVPPGNITVHTNCGNIVCQIENVIQDWVRYTLDNKEWSYRTIKTNRGHILQTRWGSIGTHVTRLRTHGRIFSGRWSCDTATRAVVNRKRNSGYVIARVHI